MPNSIARIQAWKRFFTEGKRYDWNVVRRNPFRGKFFVKLDICIAINSRNHADFFPSAPQEQ